MNAVEAGDLDMLKRMIQSDKKENPKRSLIRDMGNTLILSACQRGHIDIVEYLLDNGVSVHVDHDSPLQWAAQRGDQDLTMVLLDRGANPHALNNCPLRLALHMGHREIAKILVDHSPLNAH